MKVPSSRSHDDTPSAGRFRKWHGMVPGIICLALVALLAGFGSSQEPKPKQQPPDKGKQGGPHYDLTFDAHKSTKCGPGQLCFNYELPKNPTGNGQVKITLSIYQNGALVSTQLPDSGWLSSGNQYCFPITAAWLSGLAAVGGFDLVATGDFKLGTATLPPIVIGVAHTGTVPDFNNDYAIKCDPGTATKDCCNAKYNGPNLLQNPSFESGNVGINSPAGHYTYGALGAPGNYNVITSGAALVISPNWVVTDHAACNSLPGTQMLIVNGRTMQPLNTKKIVWTQTHAIKEGGDYLFCMFVKNLPQTAIDIKPRIEVVFNGFGVTPLTIPATVTVQGFPVNPGDGCLWQLVQGIVTVVNGANMTIAVKLYEDGQGDGNDCAFDDFSFRRINPIPSNSTYLDVNYATDQTGNTFTVTGTRKVAPPADCKVAWKVCEWNGTSCVSGTTMTWSGGATCNFPGYGGTTPGTFVSTKIYKFYYILDCDCNDGTDPWLTGYNKTLKKVEFKKLPSEPNEKRPTAQDSDHRPLPKSPAAKQPEVRPEGAPAVRPSDPKVSPTAAEIRPMPKAATTPPTKDAVDPRKDKDATTPAKKEPLDPMTDKGQDN